MSTCRIITALAVPAECPPSGGHRPYLNHCDACHDPHSWGPSGTSARLTISAYAFHRRSPGVDYGAERTRGGVTCEQRNGPLQ